MKNNNKFRSVIKGKYLQLLFVFAAFSLMVCAAYLFNSRMLRDHLLNGAQELLQSAEANVKAALSEAEMTLLNSYYILQGMLEEGASKQDILDYMTITTDWMQKRDAGLLIFYGLYGFINGEFYDGIGMNPGEEYIPQTRPWYQTAIRSGTDVAYTTPYIDWLTGDTVVSAVRNIYIQDSMAGILTVDINIGWLMDYVSSLTLAYDGFGMLLSQNLSFMAYPDEDYLGRQLQDLGGDYEELARILRSGEDVFARRIIDPDRGPVIVFIKQIFNNWYVGLVTPSSQFFRDLQTSAQILVALGLVLSLALCFILVRLSAAKERSDEENMAKSSFLARMSHEIRTPLNAVIGLSEIVLNRGKLPEDSRNDIQQIHQSGSSLLGIINDILDVSKIEAGGFELIPVVYETASLINDTVNLNRVRIGSKPIKFILKISGDFPSKLLGDELRVRQIFNNILSNAIKYTKEGSVTLEIKHEQLGIQDAAQQRVRHGMRICFTVTDTGIGIKPEGMGKLFSEYTQLDTQSNRMVEGTGLGLAISKKLAEMMGGSINAISEYGKGSVFTVYFIQELPNTDLSSCIGEETAERLKQFQYVSPSGEKDINRAWMPYGKVLIVDDLPVNLQVARGLLEPYGITVETAESGQEAIDLIQAGNKYDLVFMDHMMPGMDGIEAVRLIRSWEKQEEKEKNEMEFIEQTPKQLGAGRIPIVALTANALTGNLEMFLSKGFNGFIPKPIDIVQLDQALNQWIRDKQSAETLLNLEKKEEEQLPMNKENFISIPGLDTQQGMAMTGGTEAGYIAVLSLFNKDAQTRLPLFQAPPLPDDLTMFITQVHAIKSASFSIGAAGISALAAELESAGRAEDFTVIKEKLPIFAQQLSELTESIKSALENNNAGKQSSDSLLSAEYHPLFKELVLALESQNIKDINRILRELKEKSRLMPLDTIGKETLEKISDEVMMVEYENAKKIVEEILNT